jgi:heat shock protein HslJ
MRTASVTGEGAAVNLNARRHRFTAATLTLLVFAALSGCTDSGGSAVAPLQGSWVLESGADADGAFIDSTSPVTLTVSGREFSGDSPCNLYSGTLSTAGGGVDFGDGGIASTERACVDMAQMGLEARYYAALVAIERAEARGEELVLTGAGVELVYVAAD